MSLRKNLKKQAFEIVFKKFLAWMGFFFCKGFGTGIIK